MRLLGAKYTVILWVLGGAHVSVAWDLICGPVLENCNFLNSFVTRCGIIHTSMMRRKARDTEQQVSLLPFNICLLCNGRYTLSLKYSVEDGC